jgi:uncharacterized membrane protein YgaE (UPF0421/DUF939 family)
MKWYSSMAMNSVLITHFLSFGEMTFPTVMNEMLLFVVGVGFGILANLHLHQDKETINQLKSRTDDQICHILERMSLRIVKQVDDYDGKCFDVLNDLITQAKFVAKENEANVLLYKDDDDHRYIRMRERQSQVLFEMFKNIRKLNTTPVTARLISDFLGKIAREYEAANDCGELLNGFYEIDQNMKSTPLPVMRNEFEDRARLFVLLRLIEEFLLIKYEFINRK